MQLGMIGLGRMGANIVRRLMRDGHACVVYDVNPDAVAALVAEGATGATSLDDFVAGLDTPRACLGHGAGRRDHRVDRARARGAPEPGDTSSTAGTPTTATTSAGRRARRARDPLRRLRHERRVFGLERGFCLMVGGRDDAFASARADLRARSPPASTRRRATPGRDGDPVPASAGICTAGRPAPGTS